MRFGLGPTPHNTISGWLAPDNPTLTPRFRVEVGQASYVIEADCFRSDIVDAKLHETGMVGFNIGDHNAPGITSSAEISVTELTQNKVIYRRSNRPTIQNKKLFIFNNLPVPSRLLRKDLGNQFTLAYPAIDDVGIETALALLGNTTTESIFAEGRFSLQEYLQYLVDQGYIVAALLVEPFFELANRLLVVKTLLRADKEQLVDALPAAFQTLKDCARQLDDDYAPRTLNAIFSSLGPDQKMALENPLVRQLSCRVNDDPEPHHVPAALGVLSELAAVGLTSQMPTFREALEPLVAGLDFGDSSIPEVEGAIELETALRASPVVNRLLRHDLRLYSYVEKAIAVAN